MIVRLGVLVCDARAAAHFVDHFREVFAVDAVLAQDAARRAVLFVGDGEQQMLGRDVLVLHLLGLLLRRCIKLRGAWAKILLPALNFRLARNLGLEIVQDDLQVDAELAQERAHDAFGLL